MHKHGSRSIVPVTAGGWNIPDTPSHRHSKYSRQATTEFDGRADWRQTQESEQSLIIHCHVRESRFSIDASPDDVWAAIRRPLSGCRSSLGTRCCAVRCHSNQGPAARCNDGWRVRWSSHQGKHTQFCYVLQRCSIWSTTLMKCSVVASTGHTSLEDRNVFRRARASVQQSCACIFLVSELFFLGVSLRIDSSASLLHEKSRKKVGVPCGRRATLKLMHKSLACAEAFASLLHG